MSIWPAYVAARREHASISQQQRRGVITAINSYAGHHRKLSRGRVPHLRRQHRRSGSIKAACFASANDKNFSVRQDDSIMLPPREMHAASELPRRRSRIQVDYFCCGRWRVCAANHRNFSRRIHYCRTIVAKAAEVQHGHIRPRARSGCIQIAGLPAGSGIEYLAVWRYQHIGIERQEKVAPS